ncbi:MAG: hypothetical protein JTT11_01395 [Candidatus Brockarchaeota archaeon]|nr:hypothetical protein [Candidatus Brockarchaeota archaeon]
MPAEVKDLEEFLRLAEHASECVVKRSGNDVKLKLKAGKLFTMKVSPDEADGVIKKLRCPITDFGKKKKP